MSKFLRKFAWVMITLMIPTLFLTSCSEDMVEPDNATPPKGQLIIPSREKEKRRKKQSSITPIKEVNPRFLGVSLA